MIKNWKMIAISAGIAFLLSFISGFFGRVSLGVLILRALLGGILFGVLAMIVSVLVSKFLPELYDLHSDSLGDESLVQAEESSLPEIVETPDSGGSQIDISIGDIDEEPSVEIKDSTVKIDSEDDSSEKPSLVEEVEETASDDSSSVVQVSPGLDVLPDMGVFSNSFVGDIDDSAGSTGKAGSPTLDIMGVEQDPELVVRAVRTMVKKDQEG